MLTVIDEFTRRCMAVVVERRLNSDNVLHCLTELFVQHGPPDHIRSDNGSEFTAHAVRDWLGRIGVKTRLWREKAIAGIDASLKERKGDPVKAELDIAMKRIGELIMQVELLEAKTRRPALWGGGGRGDECRHLSRHGFGLRPPAGLCGLGFCPFLVLRHEIPAAGHR